MNVLLTLVSSPILIANFLSVHLTLFVAILVLEHSKFLIGVKDAQFTSCKLPEDLFDLQVAGVTIIDAAAGYAQLSVHGTIV